MHPGAQAAEPLRVRVSVRSKAEMGRDARHTDVISY